MDRIRTGRSMRRANAAARRRTAMPSATGITVSSAMCAMVAPSGRRMSALSPIR